MNSKTLNKDMSIQNGRVDSKYTFSSMLEFAADNDVDGFTRSTSHFHHVGGEVGLWYTYQKASRRMATEHVTPLLIAARYGSVDIVSTIISQPGVDVNQVCEPEKSTALHCAASGGSASAVDIIKLLLLSGANVNAVDASGHRPLDVVVTCPDRPDLRLILQELLKVNDYLDQPGKHLFATNSELNSVFSSKLCQITSTPTKERRHSGPEKGKKKIGPSLLDEKDSMYLTDEFRMYSFKIEPCSRIYSHDWTQCPFAHPGENARRRDLRKFHYSCVPCSDFKKGTCRRGDLCTYAHGLFECWLHPTQYRTRMCKDGSNCTRRVCFFAHTIEELRPVHLSAGSEAAYPRVANCVEAINMDAGLSHMPGSPSAFSVVLPNPSSPPTSPIKNGIPVMVHQSFSPMHINWSIPRENALRSYLNARGRMQQMNLPFQSSISFKHKPPNFYELSTTESLFPHCFGPLGVSSFSPSQKQVFPCQFQQQPSLLFTMETTTHSPKNLNHPFWQVSEGVLPLQAMSSGATTPLYPSGSNLSSCDRCKKSPHHLCGLLSQDLESRKTQEINHNGSIQSPVNSLARKSVLEEIIDWSFQAEKLDQIQRFTQNGLVSPVEPRSAVPIFNF